MTDAHPVPCSVMFDQCHEAQFGNFCFLARIILEESPQQLGAQLICLEHCAAAPAGAQCRTSRSAVADRIGFSCIASGGMKAILA